METISGILGYLGRGFMIAIIMYIVIIITTSLVLSIKETANEKGIRKPLLYTVLVLSIAVLMAIIFIKIMPYLLLGILICIGMCLLFLGFIFIYELIKILLSNFISKK